MEKQQTILRPEDFKHQTLQVGDLQMHMVIEGAEGAPLIVLLHGFPEFWYSWRHQIKPLAEAGYRVVAVDQRGYNLTEKREPYDIFTLSDDVGRLIGALGYEKAAAVMGHDWGGVITWIFGALHPELTEKLIACNAPHLLAGMQAFRSFYLPQIVKSWYMFFFQLPGLPEQVMSANDYKALADGLKNDSKGTLSDEEIKYFKEAWSQPGALTAGVNWYRAMFRDQRRINKADLTVPVPSLLIWGDQDIALTTQTAEWTRRYVPNLTIKYIHGASHWVQQECPEMVNRYALDFLKGVR